MFNKTYNINFITNSANTINAITCKYKNKFPVLPTPLKDGYNFKGWFVDETLLNEVSFDIMPKNDVVLYAKWENISLDEFLHDVDFYTKSANILQNLQNEYDDVPTFKDVVVKKSKVTKKKVVKKKTTTKSVTKKTKVVKKEEVKVEDNENTNERDDSLPNQE